MMGSMSVWAQRSITPSVDRAHYVIFDLDDTLVHCQAVRYAFGIVAAQQHIDRELLNRTLEELPGYRARDIFAALGLEGEDARAAGEQFIELLTDLDEAVPTVAYPDADETLRALAAHDSMVMLSTGSPPERARKVIAEQGWDSFAMVLGSDGECFKGAPHYERMIEAADDPEWTLRAVTVGDSPEDMRLGVEYGVALRIGVDRTGDPWPLLAAGATHVVSSLSEIVEIVVAA
jgi:phosphoglycolate phosphatase-like HAD superfamily hydrolase